MKVNCFASITSTLVTGQIHSLSEILVNAKDEYNVLT